MSSNWRHNANGFEDEKQGKPQFATRREAMDEVMDYNHKRLHSTLGYVSPMTFEQRWFAAQQQGKKPA